MSWAVASATNDRYYSGGSYLWRTGQSSLDSGGHVTDPGLEDTIEANVVAPQHSNMVKKHEKATLKE